MTTYNIKPGTVNPLVLQTPTQAHKLGKIRKKRWMKRNSPNQRAGSEEGKNEAKGKHEGMNNC